MTSLDQQLEDLITDLNNTKDENKALKVDVEYLTEQLKVRDSAFVKLLRSYNE